MTDTIDMHGDPLAFKLRQGRGRSPLLAGGRDVIKVEARQMAGHQKEAVVTEGADASAWRLTSDEGRHLRGTDLAPFPLGFFNAGMQSDLRSRSRARRDPQHRARPDRNPRREPLLAHGLVHPRHRRRPCRGAGHRHPRRDRRRDRDDQGADRGRDGCLLGNRIPAHAARRSTFALYINGRRRTVAGVANSPGADAVDPYRVYARAPRPLDPNARRDLIEEPAAWSRARAEPASATVTNKLIRNVLGEGKSLGRDGMYEADTWLGMPGTSHFRLTSDEGAPAPRPAALRCSRPASRSAT